MRRRNKTCLYYVMNENNHRVRFFAKDARDVFLAGNPLRRRLTCNELAKFRYRDRTGSAGRQRTKQ